ncbi:hypothetical protein PHMEG_00032402 [Phytophthora megakarya]|uniref:Uncharacterized protein n=1 Tax=Phytophthora megakarya TaxID=4795 RepID=A0A225UVT1_9STRA|nr:hypothetical protein PHMEG_00032402 [Phytophthora megakarya]
MDDFLQGPKRFMSTKGIKEFMGLTDACSNDKKAYVIITKTSAWYDESQEKVNYYKEELERIAMLLRETPSASKKPRLE